MVCVVEQNREEMELNDAIVGLDSGWSTIGIRYCVSNPSTERAE